jgi:hypothetical protein
MSDKKQFKYMYHLVHKAIDEENSKFEIIGNDGFKWAEASNPKGALFGALAIGIKLNDVEINTFVPDFEQVIARANG